MSTNIDTQNQSANSDFLTYVGASADLSEVSYESKTRRNSLPDITEDQLASEFVGRYRNDLRYCHSRQKWLLWNGYRWQADEIGTVLHGVRMLCRERRPDGKPKLGSAATVNAVAKLAASDPLISRVATDFDVDDLLLNTPGGIVDLRTGELLPPDSSRQMTRSATATPAESVDCPMWLRFLDEATKGDKELQRLLQQMAGYALTGSTEEQVLFFIYGDGGNGKSVFLNVLAHVLGDYAATASLDLLTASSGERHPTDLAVLNGPRLVTVSETEEGKAWAEAKLKTLTGGDTISARFMRQDPFEFKPHLKLLIVGNHKPNLKNVDEAIMRRLRLVPFVNKPEQPDRKLGEKLKAEGPGILRWAIEGCLDWQKNGLAVPKSVSQATRDYFEAQDVFKLWLEDCTEEDAHGYELFSDLLGSWKEFAGSHGEEPGSGKSFGAKLDRYGFYRARRSRSGNTVSVRQGLTLKTKQVGYPGQY